MKISETALRISAQQVERCGGLKIGLQHPVRIGDARSGGEADIIDDIAAIGGKLRIALFLKIRGTRLGELPGHAPDLHHRLFRRKGQHHRHLQENAECVADIVAAELSEAFSAVAALKQEGFAFRHIGEL